MSVSKTSSLSPGICLLSLLPILATLSLHYLTFTTSKSFTNFDDTLNFLSTPPPSAPRFLNVPILIGVYEPAWHYVKTALSAMSPPNAYNYGLLALFLHCANTALVFTLTVTVTAASTSAASTRARTVTALLVSLLYTTSPLRIEPVLWLSCLPYLLATLALLLSLLLHVENKAKSSTKTALVALLFAFACGCKASAVTAFAIHLFHDLHVLGMQKKQLSPSKIFTAVKHGLPLIAIGIVSAATAKAASETGGAAAPTLHLSPQTAFYRALYSLAFPLFSTVYPVGLIQQYAMPRSGVVTLPNNTAYFLLPVTFLAILMAIFHVLRHLRSPAVAYPHLSLLLLTFTALLLPTLGVFGYHVTVLTADRYTYLPMALVAPYAGQYVAAWIEGKAAYKVLWRLLCGTTALVLVAVNVQESTLIIPGWSSSHTLWSHTVQEFDRVPATHYPPHPASSVGRDAALYNLGVTYEAEKNWRQASRYYEKCFVDYPKNAKCWKAGGDMRRKNGEGKHAQEAYNKAVKIVPGWSEAWFGLGSAQMESADIGGAIQSYTRAVKIDSSLTKAWNNMGNCFRALGKTEEARASYLKCLVQDPNHAKCRTSMEGLGEVGKEKGEKEGETKEEVEIKAK